MLARYVRRDLLRNPRRTLATLAGVSLGVALFSGVLFFADGSRASMTQRAIAPLVIDMQRVLTSPLGGELTFVERYGRSGRLRAGATTRVTVTVANVSNVPDNDVVVNDEPAFLPGRIVVLLILTTGATLVSALAATAILRRVRPAELLRET